MNGYAANPHPSQYAQTTRAVDPNSPEGLHWARLYHQLLELRRRAVPMAWYLDQLGDA